MLTVALVDGYVWVGAARRPGLGAHLHGALGGGVAVVGVAKSRYRGTPDARPVRRGGSARPLPVTAVGMAPELAAERVRSMHGEHRLPTLLRRVDQLCRGLARPGGPG